MDVVAIAIAVAFFAAMLLLIRGHRPDMTALAPIGAFVAHMSAADFFGLLVSVAIVGYLLYALVRGERF